MKTLRRSLVAATAASLMLLALAGSASAFSVNRQATVAWPFDTITFYVDDDARYRTSVLRAVRGWNNRDAGYTFVRTSDPEEANVVFYENLLPGQSDDRCTGSTIQGFGFASSFVILGGDCDQYIMTLAASHELGHLLTLNHENDTCAVMNTRGFANIGRPRLARPSECRRGPEYYRAPVRSDDAAGGRAARQRPFRLPPALCFESDGSFQSQLTADDLLCNFQYDWRGEAGADPNENPSAGLMISRGCERSEYDRTTRGRRNAKVGSVPPDAHGRSHAGEHAFGESPGVETFGYSR